MARFRPSRLFRRLSSRSDVHNAEKSRSDSRGSSSPSASAEVQNPAQPVYSTPPSRQLKKSSSLPRLRKRGGSQSTAKSGGEVEREREASVPEVPLPIREVRESVDLLPEVLGGKADREEERSESRSVSVEKSSEVADPTDQREEVVNNEELRTVVARLKEKPIVTVQHPTPDVVEEVNAVQLQESPESRAFDSGQVTLASPTPEDEQVQSLQRPASASTERSLSPHSRPERPSKPAHVRQASIVDSANAKIVKTLLDTPGHGHDRSTSDNTSPPTSSGTEYFVRNMPSMATMLHRKIWVKRPGASATLVQIKEDDLVDDVRDMILRKYANSLGRTFDAPDMTLHILSRAEQGANKTERMLGPEEEICRTIDQMYPGGQAVDDALIINVPQRRTPKPSPRLYQQYQHSNYHALDEYRPLENGTDYFPPMPVALPPTLPQTSGSEHSRSSQHHHTMAVVPTLAHGIDGHPRSISVLNTGQIPPLPSPGGRDRRHQHRPKYQRQPTSSPTILAHPNAGAVAVQPLGTVHRQSTRPRLDSSASEAPHRPNGISIPAPPPLPSPPAPEAAPTNRDNSAPPTPSAAVAPAGLGPNSRAPRPKKPRKTTPENQSGTIASRRKKDSSSASSAPPNSSIASMLDASVPPINVLIVEDNTINLRILEGLMKRLKVRWATAMNGQIAVDKWKAGGFHLVLMDIQMPVMNGLQATKEIRRLERANGIGVFSSVSPDADDEERGPNGEARPSTNGDNTQTEVDEKEKKSDALPGLSEGLIKSPIIIVALTASSLQSDRHEALAAGCNDFLTKPVNFVWLERKVKEWGCMQALIDFDGWRKWKEFAAKEEAGKSEEEKRKDREREEKERVRAEKMAQLAEKQAKQKEEKERKKRMSLEVGTGGQTGQGPASPGLGGLRREEEGMVASGVMLESGGLAKMKTGRQVLGETLNE